MATPGQYKNTKLNPHFGPRPPPRPPLPGKHAAHQRTTSAALRHANPRPPAQATHANTATLPANLPIGSPVTNSPGNWKSSPGTYSQAVAFNWVVKVCHVTGAKASW